MNAPAAAWNRPEDDRIRVLFVMIQMAMGGTERLIFNLVRNLDRRVFEPSIAWFANEQPLKEFQDLGVPLHYVPKHSRVDWRAMRSLADIVRRSRIDIVNAHHFLSMFYAYYGARVSNDVTLVFTEHSEADVRAAGGKWQAVGSYLLGSAHVVGISPRVSATLAEHFSVPRERVYTIENGVDISLFREDQLERANLRRQYGFSPVDTLIGLVGNFRRNKNHLFLLKAFREIVRLRPGVKLLFVGQGFAGDPENSEPEVTGFIREHALERSVVMMGYQSNVQELLRMLDIVSLVSYSEGLPLSLVEGMATGLPVVGTDIEGIRSVVEPELTGLLAAPDDVPALTAALARLIDDADLRRRMGKAARQRAAERYSLARCVKETEALFASVLPKRRMPLNCERSTVA